MTNEERIEALPLWKLIAFNNAAADKMRANWMQRNATAVATILDSLDETPDPWGMQPVSPPETDEESPGGPETPDEDLEQPTAGEGE